MTDINVWAAVDDSNNAAAPAGWPEGMMPSGVNNAARAMMGALKRWRDQSQPTVTATGSVNAQIVTYPVAPATLAAGDTFAFFALANTGPATLQVNAQTAAPIVTSIGTPLIGGEMPAGAAVMVVYDGTNFRMLTAPTPLSISNGGTGQTTPGAAADAIGAVKDTGDTMTGNLTVPAIVYSIGPGHAIGFGWDGANLQMYVDGTPIGPVGDITSVAAGNGLTGGGTGGALSLAMSGSFSGNFGATGTVTAAAVTTGGAVTAAAVTTGGAVTAGQFTSNTGGVNVTTDIQGRDVYARAINASANISSSSIGVSGAVSGATVTASGTVNAVSGQMFMGPGGSGRQLQMASGWYWDFNTSTGDLVWGGPSGAQFWVTRYSDHYCGNQIGPVFGTTFITTSDARGKTDIVPANQGLDEILQLHPVAFRRTDSDRGELGFTAQDVQQIIPEAVWPLPDKDGADRLGVSLDPIVATLVNAVQTLAARLEQLETALTR